MKSVSEFTPIERSQLLYLECRAVDDGGYVDTARMNEDDFAVSNEWHTQGYIIFRRLKMEHHRESRTHFVRLSAQAFTDAAVLRRERAARRYDRVTWDMLVTPDRKEGEIKFS
jgi:hypothetical protein